jgi:hypothetical protein
MKQFIRIVSLGLVALSAAWRTPVNVEISKMIGGHPLGKLSNPFSSLLVLTGSAARRQAGLMSSLQSMLKNYATKPAKTVQMEPSGKRSGTKRAKIYYGPHTLPKKGEVRKSLTSCTSMLI